MGLVGETRFRGEVYQIEASRQGGEPEQPLEAQNPLQRLEPVAESVKATASKGSLADSTEVRGMLLCQGVRAQCRNLSVRWPNGCQALEQRPLQDFDDCTRMRSSGGTVHKLARIPFPEFRQRNARIENF